MKKKIVSGFPVNNGMAYIIFLEDNSLPMITNNKESYEKAMEEGYLECMD